MKKSLLLVFLLAYSFAYSQHLVKPDTLWTYGPGNFTSYPAVHPNGNVLVRIDFDVHELNGLTGELIRKINIPVGTSYIGRIDISQDGTRLLAGGYYIDYNSGELIRTLPNSYRSCFIHPFNNKMILIKPQGYEHIDSNIIIYNLETDEAQFLNTVDFPTALAVSSDGRYLAVGCWDYETDRTHFELYDAQTLKLIRELEDVPSTGRRIEFIQFSETAKYVGYGHLSFGKAKATIFSCINMTITEEFNCPSLGLINDYYAFVLCDGSFLWDLNSEKIIYQTNNYGSSFPVYNNSFHTIIVRGIGQKLVALDLEAIISGVDVNGKTNPEDNLKISYLKGYLQITDIEPSSVPIDIKLFDLNGKLIYQSMQPIVDDSLQIQIGLISGVYILQIQTGNKQYSQKFIVSN